MIAPPRSLLALVFLALAHPVAAQLDPATRVALEISSAYRVFPNVTYGRASGTETQVDVYAPRNAEGPRPTVLYFHGGGWVGGSKERSALALLPYMAEGFVAVNVQYRLARVALAPAAVEDTRCALRWVIANAERYGIDPERIVVTGHSAGGHLSLTTGMVPVSAGLDRRCAGLEDVEVAAVVNWFGITDVNDLTDGPNTKSYAVAWLGSMPDRREIGERVSPLTWVRPGLPPILTIHGDDDQVVPYTHAARLHEALDEAGVPNELVTIPGGGHGGFGPAHTERAWEAIMAFLREHGVTAE